MDEHAAYDDSVLSDDFRDEADIIQSAELSDDKKRELLSLRFSRTASNGDTQALERLWDKCQGSKWINVNCRDDEGSTPLICAACFGHTEVIELLLKYGADVNGQDKSGWTALMWATTNHNEDLVRVLLDHGASSAAKTARGHTAMNIASSNLSGSDTESFRRGSESPPASDGVLSQGNEEPALASVSPPRAGSLSEASAHEQANGGDASEALKDSPRPAGHAFVGTPTRKGQARDPASAGQSVLSMLQASSAKTGSRTRDSSVVSGSERGHISPTRSASSSQVAAEGLGLAISGDREPSGNPILSADSTVAGDSELADRLRTLTMNKAEYSDSFAKDGVASNGGDKSESQPFDWDTLQLDQMYVISAATVPQFLHAVVKDVRPERWIQANVQPEHKFIAASMIFLAARFAHHLGTPDFLESFLTDTIAAIIHEVQSHKADPISLAFWMSNIQALIYFFKRDAALVQATSEAQGRLSECMQDAYSLFTKAIQAEIEPLIDASLLAYDSMPDLFADVKFEADKSQRLSMFFFGSQTEATRKSSDGRPLRRSQTVLQKGGRGRRKGSILSAVRPSIETTHSGANGAPPATASGDVPAWIACVERAKYVSSSTTATGSAAASDVRPSSGDTFVSGRASQDTQRPSLATAELFGHPSPRTVTYMLERMLDLFDMCETHPYIVWGIMRQMFCYLGSEMFNRVLTTRDFCSRSRAMQIRMNATQINDWVRKNTARLPVPQSAGPAAARSSVASTASFDSGNGGNEKSANASTAPETGVSNPEMLLYETYFKPLIELVQLLQCLTHLPDLSEYLETTSSMLTLNLLQQETVVSNYRYEVHESRVASDVAEYLQSAASDVRDRQRASREKVSMDKASRRSMASVVSERRTMDGRPGLLSFDLTSSGPRGIGGLVRFSAEPTPNAGLASDATGAFAERAPSLSRDSMQHRPAPRLSSESSQLPISSSSSTLLPIHHHHAGPGGAAAGARQRSGTKSNRRSMLLPIARPPGGAGGAKPSARTLFAGPTNASAGGNMPIGGRQRAHTAIDSTDASSDDAGSIVLDSRLSGEIAALHRDHLQYPPALASHGDDVARSSTAPSIADDMESAARDEAAELLTSSLRGPKGKGCRAEDMNELLDSAELLPFAVPTSREWLSWWKSHVATDGLSRSSDQQQLSHNRDWSNETVAYHQPTSDGAASSKAADGARLRAELIPVVPAEFLNVLDQIA